jgi:hypothetical protein
VASLHGQYLLFAAHIIQKIPGSTSAISDRNLQRSIWVALHATTLTDELRLIYAYVLGTFTHHFAERNRGDRPLFWKSKCEALASSYRESHEIIFATLFEWLRLNAPGTEFACGAALLITSMAELTPELALQALRHLQTWKAALATVLPAATARFAPSVVAEVCMAVLRGLPNDRAQAALIQALVARELGALATPDPAALRALCSVLTAAGCETVANGVLNTLSFLIEKMGDLHGLDDSVIGVMRSVRPPRAVQAAWFDRIAAVAGEIFRRTVAEPTPAAVAEAIRVAAVIRRLQAVLADCDRPPKGLSALAKRWRHRLQPGIRRSLLTGPPRRRMSPQLRPALDIVQFGNIAQGSLTFRSRSRAISSAKHCSSSAPPAFGGRGGRGGAAGGLRAPPGDARGGY